MAKASGLSVSCVHRIWRAFSLQPHRSGSFRLSADSPFVVRQTATPACPLHADLGVRSTRSNGSSRWYRSADQTRCPSLHQGRRGRHLRLHRRPQRLPQSRFGGPRPPTISSPTLLYSVSAHSALTTKVHRTFRSGSPACACACKEKSSRRWQIFSGASQVIRDTRGHHMVGLFVAFYSWHTRTITSALRA